MKTIGERVRQLRKEKGFARQGDLGRQVGVDQSVISDIENGAGFKADVLIALCRALETTPEYLMLGQEFDKGEAEMLTLFRKTSEEGRIAMIAMARGVQKTYPKADARLTVTAKPRVTPEPVMHQPDTFVSDVYKHLKLKVPGTGSKGSKSDERSTNPNHQSPERGKHVAGTPSPRRTGRT